MNRRKRRLLCVFSACLRLFPAHLHLCLAALFLACPALAQSDPDKALPGTWYGVDGQRWIVGRSEQNGKAHYHLSRDVMTSVGPPPGDRAAWLGLTGSPLHEGAFVTAGNALQKDHPAPRLLLHAALRDNAAALAVGVYYVLPDHVETVARQVLTGKPHPEATMLRNSPAYTFLLTRRPGGLKQPEKASRDATALGKALASDDWQVRFEAAGELAVVEGIEATGLLRGTLDDKHEWVRLAALRGLALRRDRAALPLLREAFFREGGLPMPFHEPVQESLASQWLAEWGPSCVDAAMLDALRAKPARPLPGDAERRRILIVRLVQRWADLSGGHAARWLADSDDEVRLALLRGVLHLTRSQAVGADVLAFARTRPMPVAGKATDPLLHAALRCLTDLVHKPALELIFECHLVDRTISLGGMLQWQGRLAPLLLAQLEARCKGAAPADGPPDSEAFAYLVGPLGTIARQEPQAILDHVRQTESPRVRALLRQALAATGRPDVLKALQELDAKGPAPKAQPGSRPR